MNDKLPKRKNPRLANFDYNSSGAYFVTICTKNRQCIFSRIVGSIHESTENKLSAYGVVVESIINSLPLHFNAVVDNYVIMPNHIHLLIMIEDNVSQRTIRESSLQRRSTLSKVVGYIKMKTSKEIHLLYGDIDVWQTGYHDHIIRDMYDYKRIYDYICINPYRWIEDCFYKDIE